MSNCQIIIKINDFLPKKESLEYNNYKCLISIGNNISEIYLSNYKNEFFHHKPKIISSDLIYKIKLIDCLNNSLIGGSELVIPYDKIIKISYINPIIYNSKLKLIIDTITKRKIFNSLISKETIILDINIEINLIKQNNNNLKVKTNNKKIINKSKSNKQFKQFTNISKEKKDKSYNNTSLRFKSSNIINNKIKNKNNNNNIEQNNFKLKIDNKKFKSKKIINYIKSKKKQK